MLSTPDDRFGRGPNPSVSYRYCYRVGRVADRRAEYLDEWSAFLRRMSKDAQVLADTIRETTTGKELVSFAADLDDAAEVFAGVARETTSDSECELLSVKATHGCELVLCFRTYVEGTCREVEVVYEVNKMGRWSYSYPSHDGTAIKNNNAGFHGVAEVLGCTTQYLVGVQSVASAFDDAIRREEGQQSLLVSRLTRRVESSSVRKLAAVARVRSGIEESIRAAERAASRAIADIEAGAATAAIPRPDIRYSFPDNPPPLPEASGVYFVWVEDAVVYVGKSTNLSKRCTMRHDNIYAGDHLSWLLVPPEELNGVEREFIRLCGPVRNNGGGNGRKRVDEAFKSPPRG
jgi:hypothetical protein